MPRETVFPPTADNPSQVLNRLQTDRSKIVGTGIVCGFDVFMDDHCHVSIYNGVGLSSTGLSICDTENHIYHYCRKYEDPDGYFKERIGGNTELFELLEKREQDAIPLTPQGPGSNSGVKNIEEKVVVLYVGKEREEQGPIALLLDQEAAWQMLKHSEELHLRCLLTEKEEEEAELSIFNDSSKDDLPSESELYNAVNRKFLLNDIRLRRFGFSQASLKDLDPGKGELQFEQNHSADNSNSLFEDLVMEYCQIITNGLQQLDKGIENMHLHYGQHIDAYHQEYLEDYFKAFLERWSIYLKQGQKESIQYVYGFIKDLVTTYNELRLEICELVAVCNPDPAWHPRHLMLGKVQDEVLFQPSIYRHYFTQPPVYNDNADRLQKVRMLHWRMVVMFKCFYIPGFENEDFSDEHYAIPLKTNESAVPAAPRIFPFKMTPSSGLETVLGKRAIPYYYFLSRSLYSLQHYWNYEMTKCNKEDHHFSYHASYDDDSYTTLDSIIHPFAYSVDEFPFYRMEGHIGRIGIGEQTFFFPIVSEDPPPVEQLNIEVNSDAPLALSHYSTAISPTGLSVTGRGIDQNRIHALRDRYNLNFDVEFIDITYRSGNEFDGFNTRNRFRGMEHIGGVMRGGTWIVLTEQRTIQIEVEISDPQRGQERRLEGVFSAPIIVGDFYYPGKCKNAFDDYAYGNVSQSKNVEAEAKNEKPTKPSAEELLKTDTKATKASEKTPTKSSKTPRTKKAITAKKSSQPASVAKQDLKKIKGINSKIEKTLNHLGFYNYQQIAELLDVEKKAIAQSLKIDNSKIEQEDWSGQAGQLMNKN